MLGVHRILEQSDDGLGSEEAEREWDGVIRERMERYDCGKAKARPASEVPLAPSEAQIILHRKATD